MFTVDGADRLDRILARLAKVGSRATVIRLADELVERTKARFQTKRSPSGDRWKPWSEEYAATRPPGASLLIDDGDLMRSIEARVANDTIQIGSTVDYAGAVQARRPFFGIGPEDETELMDMLESEVAGAFSGV